jgi:alkylated DNA nucleotide flippase Atl1
MQYANLDTIVRNTLLSKGKPIHWYAEYLFHAANAIRTLATDTLQIINTKSLPVNSYYAVDLPDDFVDDIAVTIPVGGTLQHIPKNDNITPLRTHDSTGAFTAHTSDSSEQEVFFGFGGSWSWYWNVNDYGEPMGRMFGVGGGAKANTYKVIRERRQIQLAETTTTDEIVLLYISNGMSVDNASRVDYRAWDAIQAFINWKRSPNADVEMSAEGMAYLNQRRLLRGKMNDLTVTDIKDIIRKNYIAAPKN